MSSQPAVQRHEIEQILGAQPGAQTPFAQYIVNMGPVQGSVINLAPSGQQAADRIRPRPRPPHVLPRRVSHFLNRSQELRVVGEALARGQVVDVHAADGMGKTSLLSQSMHLQLPGDYPEGIVYLTVRHDTRDDLLQELVEHFYDTADGRVKVTENDARRLMAGKRALIVLDEANHLEEGDAEAITLAAPQAAFVVAGRQPQLWQGESLALSGLPPEEALALFQHHWGQDLAQEQPQAQALCHTLRGAPLPIVKAARTAKMRRVPLAQLLQELQPPATEPRPMEQLFWMLGQHLSEGERQVLAALAAPGGPSVSHAALAHISAVTSPKLEQYLQRLETLGLLHIEDGRYALDEALRPYIRQHAVTDDMLARAAAYYLQQAGSLQPRSRHPDEENVIAALAYYSDRGQWPEVLRMIRAMEPYLVTSGRWGQWRKRLQNAWHAGRQLGDPATEAWAQNQLGIVALAAGDRDRAVQLFRGALRGWQALGDRAGAAIAGWNLQVLLGPPPPPRGERPEPAPEAGGGTALPVILGGISALPVLLGGIAATLLVILGALVWLVNNPPPGPPLATTAVPPATITAPGPTATAPGPTATAPRPATSSPRPVTSSPRPVTIEPPALSTVVPLIRTVLPLVTTMIPGITTAPPTTIVPPVTTTVPPVTTIVPPVTTTVPPVTTTVTMMTVTVPTVITTAPPPTIGAPLLTATVPSWITALPPPTIAVPPPAIAVPQRTSAASEPATSTPVPARLNVWLTGGCSPASAQSKLLVARFRYSAACSHDVPLRDRGSEDVRLSREAVRVRPRVLLTAPLRPRGQVAAGTQNRVPAR